MKRISIITLAFAIIASAYIISSCTHTFDCGSETKVSTANGKSHNAGKDCLSCHTSGGQGEGCFSAGGTVYDKTGVIAPTASILFYSAPNGGGTLKATIPVNTSGSFYSSQSMVGYYPAVVSKAGVKTFMSTPIATGGGGCALCHGNTTDKILVN
jgi:cytochrome c553